MLKEIQLIVLFVLFWSLMRLFCHTARLVQSLENATRRPLVIVGLASETRTRRVGHDFQEKRINKQLNNGRMYIQAVTPFSLTKSRKHTTQTPPPFPHPSPPPIPLTPYDTPA